MNIIKKENLLKELKEHISMLLEFNRFEMARFYCDVAVKISYDIPVTKDILSCMTDKRIEIDNHIKEYLENK